ncbi:hypothetical protein FOH38_02150 [Lysinibacillus fusiformis]|nr:hypothetical protein FOH38_02150 [Lysinibacillus fusiformis]
MTKFNVGDSFIYISKKNTGFFTKNQNYKVLDTFSEGVSLKNNYGQPYKITFNYLNKNFKLADSKPTKNQRITALETEVAELKLIVHQIRESKVIDGVSYADEPSTQLFVEDIIEFEGKQYRKVDREAEYGDVVVFTQEHVEKTNENAITEGKPYEVIEAWGEPRFLTNENGKYRVYEEGFGRTPENVDVYELIESKPLTPNQQRAAIIEKAMKFVEQVIERGKNRDAPMVNEGHMFYRNNFYNVDLHVKNNKVTALVFLTNSKGDRLGNKPDLINRAKCNPSDVFNEHIGKAIALGRALGLDVSEFEQAVQPMEFTKGQIVVGGSAYPEQREVTKVTYGDHVYRKPIGGSDDDDSWCHAKYLTIINDTNAIYGGVE